MSVFVIINEWVKEGGAVSECVYGYEYYTDEDSARKGLESAAERHYEILEPDSYGFIVDNPPHGIEFEEYYIQELTKSGN